MSIDAGGLAQMTYQSPFNGSIGVSGPGFASRGKGSHIKRLSVAPPSKISTIDETQQTNTVSTPRTSRGHLLAGLRTAPKSATVPHATNGQGLESSRYASMQYSNQAPQTATGMYFPQGRNSFHGNYQQQQQHYSLPEHVLAPPSLDFVDGAENMDQTLYDELVATNNYLAQQQRALQQQLLSVTAAAHQFSGLNLNTGFMNNIGQQQFQSPISSPMGLYNQQLQQGLQPMVQQVPGSPGVFAVYNPMTGQSSYVVDKSYQQQQQQQEVSPNRQKTSASPPPANPGYHRQYPEPSFHQTETRSKTPPKSSPSPAQDVEPLPPPSANAFRRGHRKNMSSANIKTNNEWTKGAGARPGFPQTPLTATFGPGHGRAGEHPVRQPKGPPLLQELEEKPTSKHEGSKNFATRQRRRAVHDLVRAGRERRSDSGRQPGSGAGTPGSENDFNFSVSSDDSALAGSSTLSSKPSLGSLRAAASGAIGSEIKEKSRERSSVDSVGALSAKSVSSDEGNSVGGPIVEIESARRNTPLLVLSSAEKRKSVVM
ncbi:hypothetical protein A1O7_10169 [Cladophialophora yegresii CBS 114405]|uniref:Uncharacterized protein n=1 Tax=Cladophialophora yegresii CBS 114405 TaxID=1182544 RepID=W9VH63_9EURO|nr:uncharacterized protein A1O7_10169 [Cladophialophora yegresii CBS 114405]EXJ54828.1 hypothetical protein A1O7_10169 [Cladophialophora yegresii CBS 114405]